MSTDWGIGCVPCAAKYQTMEAFGSQGSDKFFTGEFDNCRDIDALWRLIRARDEIVTVAKALGSRVGFFWTDYHNGGGFSTECHIADFFEEHAGHELRPMDEYCHFDGACWKTVECGSCKVHLRCRLSFDHDGLCSSERR